MEKLRIMSVFGTRPEAIKMCPLVQELANREGIESLCCVTAQHRQMLDSVLEVFQVKPDWDLDIMTPRQTLSTITSKCLTGMDEAIDALKPDMILVHGDTSTTFAGALSAFYHQVSVGHVEAGLRTYDKYSPFPEEQANEQASVADGTFQVVVAGTEASDAAVGEIVRQDPEPDTEKKGELPITINVWVSAGEDVGTMPDLTTKPMTYDQAMTILQDLVAEYELNVQPYEETQKEYDDELAVDVIKSTTPAAGAELHKGDTITFVLSRGPQTVPLIDFTNRERAWAEDQLKNVLGLEVEVYEEANDTVEAGLVIRQNPTATTQVPAGSTVELWVSTGPESGGNEDLQMEPLIIALPTDRETAEVQIVVDGVIKVNESVPCRDGNYVYELYGTGTVSVEVYVDGVMDVNNTREVTFGE